METSAAPSTWHSRMTALQSQLGDFLQQQASTIKGGSSISLESLNTKAESAFRALGKGSRDVEGLSARVLKQGTLMDKISALVVLVGERPAQSMGELKRLVQMAGSKGRREAVLAMDSLRDLFLDALLPGDRRLNRLEDYLKDVLADEHLARAITMQKHEEILGWMFYEDLVKQEYREFCRHLETAMRDTLEHHKITAMKRVCDLLLEKPEQERFLLSALCQKMGDPNGKVASQAAHLLRKITRTHPAMRSNVVSEIQPLVLTINSIGLKYTGVTFLNQTILHRGDHVLAGQLVDLYFSLFESSVGADIKLVKKEVKKKSKPSSWRDGAKVNATTADVDDGNDKEKAAPPPPPIKILDSKLLAAILSGVNRALPYCNDQKDMTKFAARCDALYRVAVDSGTFQNATQALALLFRVDPERDRVHRSIAAKLLDPALLEGKKTLFLNLLYRSLKSDDDQRRVIRTTKRLLRIALGGSPAFAASSLFLISNLIQAKPLAFGVVLSGEEDQSVTEVVDEEIEKTIKSVPEKPSTVVLANVLNEFVVAAAAAEVVSKPTQNVDASKSIEFESVAWELRSFQHHFHPTVQAFAATILRGDAVEYAGDPLHDFSISAFLDKFVYRNPKEKKFVKQAEKKTTELDNVFGTTGREQRLGKKAVRELPANSLAFHEKLLGRRVRPGDEADLFFFKYFDDAQKSGKSLAHNPADGRDADQEAMEDDYADRLADTMLKAQAGGADADFDADLDDEFADEFSDMENDEPGEIGEEDVDLELLSEDSQDQDDDDDGEENEFDSVDEDDDDDDDDGNDLSVFANADDFEGIIDGSVPMDEEKKWTSKKKRSAPPSLGSKNAGNGAGKGASKGRAGANRPTSKRAKTRR